MNEKNLVISFKGIDNVLETEYIHEPTNEELSQELQEKFSSSIKDKEKQQAAENVIESIQQEIESIDTKKDDIVKMVDDGVLRDASFLQTEIKSLLLSSKRVLETLENDIKVGAAPRMYEVYAKLLDAITSQFKELRNLNESVAKLIIENKKYELEEVKEEHKMLLSSTDALELYNRAKENSQMDTIDVEFDVLDEE